jgi:UDP:flavonoid glycosyltransferase YjiC (YdhE family)
MATALRNGGHTVAFGTAAGFANEVEQFGFKSLAVGMERAEWTEQSNQALSAMPEQEPHERIAAFCERVFGGPIARRLIDDLPLVLSRWPADIIVHEDTALGAAVAAEQLGIPHARFMVLAAGPGHPLYARNEDTVAKLREYAGLGPDSAEATLHRHLLLYPFPRSLLAPGTAAPATLRAVRPSLPELTGKEELPSWLEELGTGKRPVVYATLGTIFNQPGNDPVFADLLAALAAENVDGVMTIGRDRQVAEFGPVAKHVRLAQYIPLAALMPHLDLVVSHGGSGTLIAALAHGLPQVVVPIWADQPENAQRVADLGAGIMIGGSERSVDSIRAAIRATLSDPAYGLSAQRMKSEIAQLPDIDHAVALLEHVGAGGAVDDLRVT